MQAQDKNKTDPINEGRFKEESLWEGEIQIQRFQYHVEIYEKKGCFLIEYLNEMGKISAANLFYLFTLMVVCF